MDKFLFKGHLSTNQNINISSDEILKDRFITFSKMDEILKNTPEEKTKKLYLNTCNYNQQKTLYNFLKLLFEKFGDRLLIDSKYKEVYQIESRNENEKEKTFKTMGGGVFGCYFNFIIDNFLYYVQFCDNPFFSDSSYITTSKIYKIDNNILYKDLQNKYITLEHVRKNNKNINDLFEVWDRSLDCVESGKTLLNYFLENCYTIDDPRYTSKKDERIFILNHEKNKTDRIVITGYGKIEEGGSNYDIY